MAGATIGEEVHNDDRCTVLHAGELGLRARPHRLDIQPPDAVHEDPQTEVLPEAAPQATRPGDQGAAARPTRVGVAGPGGSELRAGDCRAEVISQARVHLHAVAPCPDPAEREFLAGTSATWSATPSSSATRGSARPGSWRSESGNDHASGPSTGSIMDVPGVGSGREAGHMGLDAPCRGSARARRPGASP